MDLPRKVGLLEAWAAQIDKEFYKTREFSLQFSLQTLKYENDTIMQ